MSRELIPDSRGVGNGRYRQGGTVEAPAKAARKSFNIFYPMSLFLDDIPERTRQLFETLAENLEAGEPLPIEILSTYLRHPEDAVRKVAVELLEYTNDLAAIPVLLKAVSDPNVEVSISAGEVLRSFRHPEVVKHLISALKDGAAETRVAAVAALRDRHALEAKDALRARLSDSEPEVRREAVLALLHYHDSELLPDLRSALRDPSAAVRKAAVAAVAEFDSAFVFDDLIALLSDDNWQVRREAASALSRFPGQATQAAFVDVLSDPAWQVVREAVAGLSRLRAGGNEHVAALLAHELATLRIAAADALGTSHDARWIPRLDAARVDAVPDVRRAVERAIFRLIEEGTPLFIN